jgi:hypothetical protein
MAALESLISARADQFFALLPGVRDGLADSIHEARVASRRLRELLPLVGNRDEIRDAEQVARTAGRDRTSAFPPAC